MEFYHTIGESVYHCRGYAERGKIKNLKAIHNDYNSTCPAAFRTGEGLLRYGICVPCSKRLPGVRDAHSEALRAQNRLLGYRRDIRYQKPPSTVRGFMCTGKGLLVYRMKRRNAAPALRSVILRKTAICMLLLLPLNSCGQLWAATKPPQTTASHCKSPQTVMDCLRLPPTPLNYRRLPRPTARLPPSRPDRYQAPANYAGAYQ